MVDDNTLGIIKMMARDVRKAQTMSTLHRGQSLTLELRRAWLAQKNGLDNATILDILVYKEVRLVNATYSMAEHLEALALYGQKPKDYDTLVWYEKMYYDFMREAMEDE